MTDRPPRKAAKKVPIALRASWRGSYTNYCKEGHPALVRSAAPGDLTEMKLKREEVELLETQALEIFTLMANDGRPFAQCLSAILLSGIQWGSALKKTS